MLQWKQIKGCMDPNERLNERRHMVEAQIAARGVNDEHVLAAMLAIPRHLFVPPELRFAAYGDFALPIACGQTISQPYIVALMTSLLQLHGGGIVLEVGTGSGYQAAVLAQIAGQVITLERFTELAESARAALTSLAISNVTVVCADGSLGCPEHAPYDGILISAAAPQVPPALFAQLKPTGRLVLPVGRRGCQDLQLWAQQAGEWRCQSILPVEFVPLRGTAGWDVSDWGKDE
jgi:protein-L-isoaspartate(D-aspartate) O-methyltransferase